LLESTQPFRTIKRVLSGWKPVAAMMALAALAGCSTPSDLSSRQLIGQPEYRQKLAEAVANALVVTNDITIATNAVLDPALAPQSGAGILSASAAPWRGGLVPPVNPPKRGGFP